MHEVGGLFDGEAEEKAELDHTALAGVERFELAEDAVEVEGGGGVELGPGHVVFKRDRLAAVAFVALLGARVVDQDAAHETGGEAVEVLAIFKVELALADKLEEELIDDAGGLEQVALGFALHEGAGDLTQLGVQQLEKMVGVELLTAAPLAEQRRDVFRRLQCSYFRPETPGNGKRLRAVSTLPPRHNA